MFPIWLRILWIMSVLISSASIVWFFFGTTANFQRSVDLGGRITFVVFWFPSIVFVLVSIYLLLKKWMLPGAIGYGIVGLLILVHLVLSIPLIEGVNTNGWIKQSVQSDPNKLTSDQELEYRIEIVNFRQKNNYELLRIKQVRTGEELLIRVDIDANQSKGISRGGDNWSWAIMSPTENPDIYLLRTTEDLGIPKKLFLIDLTNGTSQIVD